MKRAILTFVFCACSVNIAWSQLPLPDAVRAFDEGTVELLEGNFQTALAHFETADQSGWTSPALFYNMGLAYHRMNKLGLAVVYLERAKQLDPENPKILHSLTVASHKQADRFSQLPDPFWKKMHAWTARAMPFRIAFFIGLTFWLAFGTMVAGKLVLSWKGDWWRRARIVVGMIAVLLLTHALATSAWPPLDTKAVILETEVRLREAPDAASPEIIRIHEGLVVKLETQTPEWVMIELPNGTKGWVSNQSLLTI